MATPMCLVLDRRERVPGCRVALPTPPYVAALPAVFAVQGLS